MEVALLKNGLPYSALMGASEEQVHRWYAVISEGMEMEQENVNQMMASYG